jgi:hypothetical protein
VVWLEDVIDARFDGAKLPHAPGAATFAVKNVHGLSIHSCPGLATSTRTEPIVSDTF